MVYSLEHNGRNSTTRGKKPSHVMRGQVKRKEDQDGGLGLISSRVVLEEPQVGQLLYAGAELGSRWLREDV